MRRVLILLIILVLLPAFAFAGKYYNGSDWVDTIRKRWDGTTWNDTVTKRWDGVSWEIISLPLVEISHYLDFNSDEITDLAGGFTLVAPAGVATTDSTAYEILEGTQSALLRNNAGGVNELLSPTFDPQESAYYAYQFQAQATTSSWIHGMSLKSSGTLVGYIGIAVNYKAYHGTVSTIILSSPVQNTTYYVCGKFTGGTGANGYHAVNIGSNANPTLNTTTVIDNGDGVGEVDQWSIGQFSANHILFDTVKFQNTPITECAGAGL